MLPNNKEHTMRRKKQPLTGGVLMSNQNVQCIESAACLLTIPQVCQILGLGRTKVYYLIKGEGLPVVRFGRAVRVSADSLERWLQEREQRGLLA
jgi:excisionase family DNA binding protein